MKMKITTLSIFFILCSSFVFSENYSLFKKDDLYGIISKDKSIVMQPTCDWITISSDSIVCCKDQSIEIYNTSLELLFSDTWVYISYYTENEILITESMTAEKKVLNVITGNITEFHGNEKYLIELGYRDNLELVWETTKDEFLYSIVDNKGNVLLTDIEQAHSVYTNGMIAVIMKDGKSGFVNKKGKMVFETSFYIEPDDIGPRKEPIIRYFFNENYALVKNNEQKWIQYNIKGKMKSLPDNIEPADYCYENGLVPIRNTETQKYGYMNQKFKIIIPCKFDAAQEFIGLYAIVKYENKDAIIDKKGNVYFCENLKY